MENYRKVDVIRYVKEGIESGRMFPREAIKFSRIIARPGVLGEEVISWSVDSNGKEVKEKVAKVVLDEKTNHPGWVVTKADIEGNAIVDNNGHTNDWIIEDSIFIKKYEIDPKNPSLFRPKGGIQIFVQIPDNISLNQWGSYMNISAGGFINITNPSDMYGISQRDFIDTYKFVDEIDEVRKM